MVSCRAIELKVSGNHILLALGPNPILIDGNGTHQRISEFQHLTIPPDLEIHLTRFDRDPSGRIFFDPCPTDRNPVILSLVAPVARLFAYVSPPTSYCPVLSGFRRKKGAALFLLNGDTSYNPYHSRCFLEFFVHTFRDEDLLRVRNAPMLRDDMRLPFEGASIQGPFPFAQLVPKSNRKFTFAFSVRFGYCEAGPEENSLLYLSQRVRPPWTSGNYNRFTDR